MTGQGDYIIVAKQFIGRWMAWGGGLDKWGPFGQERRFATSQEAEPYLKDARRDAEHQDLEFGNVVYVVNAPVRQVVTTGTVRHGGKEILIDLMRDNIPSRQMDELGIL